VESLGDPIGVGRTAEVYDLGDGRVVKLLCPDLPAGWLDVEAEKTAAVRDAGAPAVMVHGRMEIDVRSGVIFDKAPGKQMLKRIMRSPHRIRRWARRLASIHADILHCGCADLPDVKEVLAWKIVRADALRSHEKAAARDALQHLPDGTKVLHGDFHADNVFISGGRATVIDWIDACCGDPAADIARSMWLMSPEVIPPGMRGRRVIKALAGAARGAYAREILSAAQRTRSEVRAWRLPVVAARLSEGIGHEEEALAREVRRLIGK